MPFPKTKIGDIEVSRLIIGSNWILGFSHTSLAQSKHIRDVNHSAEAIAEQFEIYLEQGVNTLLGPMITPLTTPDGKPLPGGGEPNILVKAARLAEQKTGKPMVLIASTKLNVKNSGEGRDIARRQIQAAKDAGIQIVNIAFDCIDVLMNHEDRTIDRIGDYTWMIREAGLTPMCTNHNFRVIDYVNDNNYDIAAVITPYNSAGFYLQMEVEDVYRSIQNSKIPVLTIKPLAAGRLTPFTGLSFAFATLRDCDMVAVGAMTADEAKEDIEISLAAIERKPVASLKTLPFASRRLPTEEPSKQA